MENSYYQIAHQISKNERSKHYNIMLMDPDQAQEKFNTAKFLEVFNILKDKYQAAFKLFGENNFQSITYEYFLYNPIQSSSSETYGKSFPDFIASIGELSELKYVKWIAKLDWFWFTQVDYTGRIQLPQGTLESWGNIYKGEAQINIQINESIIEQLEIRSRGKEYTIVAV